MTVVCWKDRMLAFRKCFVCGKDVLVQLQSPKHNSLACLPEFIVMLVGVQIHYVCQVHWGMDCEDGYYTVHSCLNATL